MKRSSLLMVLVLPAAGLLLPAAAAGDPFTVKDFVTERDEIRTEIASVLAGSYIKDTEFGEDTVRVTVEIPGPRLWQVIAKDWLAEYEAAFTFKKQVARELSTFRTRVGPGMTRPAMARDLCWKCYRTDDCLPTGLPTT